MSKPGALVPLTVDQDPSIPSLTINGTMLHVETHGTPSDPILIMVHGGPGGDYRSLLNAVDFVNDGFYVVFYDQRGTGLSKREDKSQYEQADAVQLYINDLNALVDHFQQTSAQKVFLMGHSWGAMLSTAYINQHPEKISGVVLAEPGGFTWDQTSDYLSRSNKIKFFSEALNDAVFPEQIIAGRDDQEILDYKASFFSTFENAPGNTIGNPGSYPFWRNGAVVFEKLLENAEKYNFDFTTNLHSFSTRVLFMYSERNQAYGPDWAATVSSPYPNVKLEQVQNCGHEMLYFGWTDLYPKAASYLNSLK
ncbi:alpha/beta hydrolase fold protein [Fluviicola taffensis DSM 16823]|uniref:Alpha/beta hydrolase fold protein n=2 Tax=Fluviicola TaxID=332102 RepID=F2IAT9_FLUTR|nr:alpha/beta hydrolase fold protein [Fluviicola taffensis DSM 16823]